MESKAWILTGIISFLLVMVGGVLLVRIFVVRVMLQKIIEKQMLVNHKKNIQEFNRASLIIIGGVIMICELGFLIFGLLYYPLAITIFYIQYVQPNDPIKPEQWVDIFYFMFAWCIGVIPWVIWTIRYYAKNTPIYLLANKAKYKWVRQAIIKELQKVDQQIKNINKTQKEIREILIEEKEKLILIQNKRKYLLQLMHQNNLK
ncbi:hypothetical protein EELLY_v1c01340 [Entomoplasma ellychniae]|uniref:Transmembrane protein n=1 Tax=Entomoplasma ellychniae TaxID=2114 RepID=A0A8E2QXW1_9MOLU|nr:hypothetical protein [Entomoplasma ellychniae]PPE04459.1 hypothetical protein EELLY_v1c01340 [Entomoplasma ellychniae]